MSRAWTATSLARHLDKKPTRILDTGSGKEPTGPVVLKLPWPPTANRRLQPIIAYRQDGRPYPRQVKDPHVVAYCEEVQKAIALQHRGYGPLTGHLYAVWEFYAGTQETDYDNLFKLIQDCCVAMQVIGDDKQIKEGRWKYVDNCEDVYVRLTLTRLL